MALSKETTDHDEIRQWAESRGAIPSEVASTHSKEEAGILRFQFPDAPEKNDDALSEISWEAFFDKFDENGLTFLYQEKNASGHKSNFNKFVREEGEGSSRKSKKGAGAAHGHTAATSGSRKKA